MELPRLEDLPLKKGQRVLVRVDLNVPLRDGVVEDDLRISTALPTIQWLRERHAVVVVAGHLGRPKGVVDPQYSMAPVARADERAPRLRGAAGAGGGRPAGRAADRVVEPRRRRDGREPALRAGRDRRRPRVRAPTSRSSATSTSTRRSGRRTGRTRRSSARRAVLPHAGGRLLHREVEVLSKLLADDVARPFVAVLGGAKVGDKLGVIDALLDRCDKVLIGGAMAFTFLLAQGVDVGDSLVQPEMVDECTRLLATGRVQIPTDFVIAQDVVRRRRHAHGAGAWRSRTVGRASTSVPRPRAPTPTSSPRRRRCCGTARWACSSSRRSRPAPAPSPRRWRHRGRSPSSVGVTAPPRSGEFGLADDVDHVSTGGGASLEFIERGDLPGLEALRAKERL